MKLHNQALKYLSVSIFAIVSIWATVFYFNLLDEINDSVDNSLARDKLFYINMVKRDTAAIQSDFSEGNFSVSPLPKEIALKIYDQYTDTTIYMRSQEEEVPVRMLSSAFEQNGRYFQLRVISSMVEEDDLIEDLFWSVVSLYVILLISIAVINNIVLKKLWKPFYSFLQQLQRFRIDGNDPPPRMQSKTREFVELKAASDTLISRTMEAYHNQKQFTENASHELQTPLSIITNKLELLLEKGSLENADADTIAQTLQVTSRLTHLNKALLLLSKIENKQFADNRPVDINELVRQTVADLEEFSSFKRVRVDILEMESLHIEMDKTLASILVSNLIRNAIFHNIPEGTAHIRISDSTMEISNTANSEALHKDIFKRFYKGSHTTGSTGLGLSVVQAICKLYGFTVTYRFTGKHNFTVRFK